ncbi:MAG: hypothetical protein AAGK97_11610, partial [Bacteroidota bacterium]
MWSVDMVRNLLVLPFLLLVWNLNSQITNDSCDVALEIPDIENNCYTTLGGQTFTLNGATPQGVFGDCVALAQDANNAWFWFTAVGCDLSINISGQGGSTATFEMTLLQRPPERPCLEFNQVACGPSINLNNATIGASYFLLVTAAGNEPDDFELCFMNAVPPTNDDPCNPTALPNNCTPVASTNVGSCGDWFDPACPASSNNTVWFTTSVDPGNNALEFDIDNLSSGGNISVAVGTFPDGCNGTFQLVAGGSYCGPAGTDLFTVTGLMDGETYYVFVSTASDQEGTFNICADQIGPPPGCSVNNTCGGAEVLTGIVTGSAPLCFPGCNILAAPEPTLGGCNMATEEVVWYSITTDATADIMNLELTSGEISSPTLQVFGGTCGGLTQISTCVTGASGTVSILTLAVAPNTTYLIAVSNDFGPGGNFELCVGTFTNASSCAVDINLEVVSTSAGSPP